MRSLEDAYRHDMQGTTVRAKAIRLYLGNHSACEIAAILGGTTTAASITRHLRLAGLGGVHWCSECRRLEET